MATITIRRLDEPTIKRLRMRAAGNGRSMEEEVRDILRNAAKESEVLGGGLGTEIASKFAKIGLDEDIAELRGKVFEPLSFNG